MLSGRKINELVKNQPFSAIRRQLLLAGFSGVVVAMTAIATPCFAAAVPALKHDFGPELSVQDVYKVGSYTHVKWGFQVNGRSFSTRLRSADGNIWRPV